MASLVIQSTMSPELVAACNALGYSEGNKYMKEPYCLETIKDLIGFLRREDDTCDVRRQLGAAQILQNDLLPIVTQHNRSKELFETCIRLMVNLTQPVDLCFTKPENKGDKIYQSYQLEVLTHQQSYKEAFSDEEFMGCLATKLKKLLEKARHFSAIALSRLMVNLTQPVDLCFTKPENKGDKIYQSYQLEVLTYQQSYKEAFSDEEFMGCLATKLKKLLEKPWEKRRDDDTLLMERILILIRNILHVPADPLGEKRTDDDVSIHDGVLWGMNTSGLDKLILYIASSEGEANWCIHAAEIVSRMLREQSAEHVAKAGTATATAEKKREMAELEAIRIKERELKKAKLKKLSSRHSRFGGTFQVKNLKSISDYDVIYHRTLPKDVNSISFELDKPPAKRPKHRMPMQDSTITRRSTLSIRMFLKDFCSLFLENCYNPLMYNVKDHILHQKAQENDDSYYLWLMRFFMEFNRSHQFHVDLISETFSVQTFHYVQMQVIKYLEMLTVDKQETKNWARRLHIALKAYRELLMTLDTISSHEDETIQESAQVVQSNVFYVIEYREILLTLLKNYTDIRNTRSFLIDLVDTTQLYLRMLENYCQGKKNIMVQKKGRRKAKRRKKRNSAANQEEASANREAELNDGWDNIAGDLSAYVQDRIDIPDNVVPFDAASEQPVEEQRSDAMIRIQQCLHNGQAGDAVALLRAAREVWPDGDVFGAADMDPEEEFMALREIHFTNLNVPGEEPAAPVNELIDEMEDEDDEEEDELQENNQAKAEEQFHFGLYVNQFSHVDVLRNYVHLLESYKMNGPHINHCIVKMLHRLCVDCEKTPKLFQLSLFYIFHQLFNDHLAKTPQFKEMVRFGRFLMGKFFAEVLKNPKIFMELLFWKDNKEVFELSEGYGSVRRQGDMVVDEWEESLKEELQELFGKFNEVEGDKDVVDHIMEHLSDESKTRKQICRQLVNMELVENIGDLKRAKGSKRAILWREEHIEELKELFGDYKDSEDVMGNIINGMIQPRPRAQIVQKLLDLELISDKKEVHKKRQKGQGRRRQNKEVEGVRQSNWDDKETIALATFVKDNQSRLFGSGGGCGLESQKRKGWAEAAAAVKAVAGKDRGGYESTRKKWRDVAYRAKKYRTHRIGKSVTGGGNQPNFNPVLEAVLDALPDAVTGGVVPPGDCETVPENTKVMVVNSGNAVFQLEGDATYYLLSSVVPQPPAASGSRMTMASVATDTDPVVPDCQVGGPSGGPVMNLVTGTESGAFIDDHEAKEGAMSDEDGSMRGFEEPMEEPIGELPEEESDAASHMTSDESSEDEEEDVGEDGEEPTKENMKPLIEKLQKKGYREQILWIQEGLKVRADDKEKDELDEEAVPVVPLEERSSHAINNKLFQRFLKRIGLKPPSDQETFWRIPGDLTPARLKERAEAIEPLEETQSAKKQRGRRWMLEEMAEEKKQKTRKPREKKTMMMNPEEALEAVLELGKVPDGGEDVMTKTPPAKSRVKRPLDSESSDGSDDEPLGDLLVKKKSAPSQPAKRSRVAVNSDSEEEEMEGETMELGMNDDDDDVPLITSKKPSALVSDDSDDDDDVPVGVLVQRKRAVLSDSESDED